MISSTIKEMPSCKKELVASLKQGLMTGFRPITLTHVFFDINMIILHRII